MHKNYREPFKMKYLVITLIGVVIFAVVLSFFTLRTPKTTNPKPVNYTQVKKDLNQQFNGNGKVATIKQEDNINDKNSKKPHTVILVVLTDKQTQKYLKTTYEAVQNDKSSRDQQLYIASIQKNISDAAKKLHNNNDVVQFVYKDGKRYVLVASFQKNRNLIKPVKVSK